MPHNICVPGKVPLRTGVASPSPEFERSYRLSDESLWSPYYPLPVENFTATGRITTIHWWGVEINNLGVPCERMQSTFIIIGSNRTGN